MRNRVLSLSLLLLSAMAFAQGPNGSKDYYANANGYKGSVLKTKLCKIIYKSSNPGYDALLTMYHKSDKRPDGYLRDWYSDTTHYVIGGPAENHSYNAEGQSYNREHTVPQSWFSKQSPMKSDGHHVVPTDGYVNNRRGNYPYGEVDPNNITYQSANGYCKLGRCKTEGYTGQVFEPDDEIKGDIARIYFYMATCYENKVSSWNSNAEAANVFNGTKYPAFTQWHLNMLMRWAKLDPVDSVEIARNDSVYKHQDNRNPFVDYPGLEEYIWGEKQDVGFNYENYDSGIEPEPNPDDPDDPDPDDPDNPDDPDDPFVIEGDTLFIETFDGCAGTGGNDNTWSGGAGSGAFVSDHSGWDAAYMAGGNECARFGSGSKDGTLTSPEIAIDGDYVLTFKVAPWNTENCSMTVSVSSDSSVNITDTSFGPMTAQQWNTYQTEISGTGTFKLTFKPSQKRFFMDEVLITKKAELPNPERVEWILDSLRNEINRLYGIADSHAEVGDVLQESYDALLVLRDSLSGVGDAHNEFINSYGFFLNSSFDALMETLDSDGMGIATTYSTLINIDLRNIEDFLGSATTQLDGSIQWVDEAEGSLDDESFLQSFMGKVKQVEDGLIEAEEHLETVKRLTDGLPEKIGRMKEALANAKEDFIEFEELLPTVVALHELYLQIEGHGSSIEEMRYDTIFVDADLFAKGERIQNNTEKGNALYSECEIVENLLMSAGNPEAELLAMREEVASISAAIEALIADNTVLANAHSEHADIFDGLKKDLNSMAETYYSLIGDFNNATNANDLDDLNNRTDLFLNDYEQIIDTYQQLKFQIEQDTESLETISTALTELEAKLVELKNRILPVATFIDNVFGYQPIELKSVYDINGRRYNKTDRLELLPDGIYVIDGRKVLLREK